MANWLKFVNSIPLIFLALLFPNLLDRTCDLIHMLLSLCTGDRDGNSAGSDSRGARDSNLDDTPAESSRSRGDDSTRNDGAGVQRSNLDNTTTPESSRSHGDESKGSGNAGVQGSNLDNIDEPDENEDLFPGSDRMDYVEIKRVYRVVYRFITDCVGSWITSEVDAKLFGFNKVANKGPRPEPQLPPSPNKQSRDRMQAWKDFSGLSRKDAMKEYIKFVLQHYPSDSNTKLTRVETRAAVEAGSLNVQGRKERSLTKLLMDALQYLLGHEHKDFKFKHVEEVPVNLKDNKGRTILHWAAIDGRLQVVMFLLNRGADKNAKDNEGKTPMHYAVIHKKGRIAGFLNSQKVDLWLKDNDGISASDLMSKEKKGTPS